MEKKSKVTSLVYKKAFNSQYGEGHIFDLGFENGDKGQYFAKTNPQTTFEIGKEAEYTIEEKQNGQYKNFQIKPVRSAGARPMGNPIYEHKRTALKCATDLVCAGKVEEKKLIEAAEKLLKFLNA